MVIGPTPPGTGVIAPRDRRRTRRRRRRQPAGRRRRRLMPTSITTAAGATQSPRTISGPADGRDQHLGAAAFGRPGRGCGNVRPSRSRRPPAAVLPSACRRWRSGRAPRARAPRKAHAGMRPAASSRPAACRAPASPAVMQPADIDRVEAVHVLGRVDRLDHRAGADMRRQRQLHQDAVHRIVGVQARPRSRAGRPRWSWRAGGWCGRRCRRHWRRGPCCARRLCWPGPRRPAPRPGPGGYGSVAVRAATLSRSAAATALPSMMRAVIAPPAVPRSPPGRR